MVVINSFLSYVLLFIILVAIAVAGDMIGIKFAQNKNTKKTTKTEKKNKKE